jgi:hypothetical protein
MSDLNLAAIHRSKEDKLVWEWGKEGGYIVSSCILTLERIKFAGTKTYVIDA